jgi:hypothetical protein
VCELRNHVECGEPGFPLSRSPVDVLDSTIVSLLHIIREYQTLCVILIINPHRNSPIVVQFDLVTMSLGTEPPVHRITFSSGSAGIRTRDLPDSTLENQAQSLSYEDTTEGQIESLSDEDTADENQESTTQSSSDDSLEGPDGSDSDEGLLFALSSSDEGLNKRRDETLELDYEAFRTITSLLALIQTWPDLRRSNTGGPKPASTLNESLVLKICNSLAVLAVIQHEVIAIGVDYQPASVQVIISASRPEQENFLNGFTKLDLLVNKNPRKSEYQLLSELTEDQLTIEPQKPTGLKEFTEENLTPDVLDCYITSHNVTRLVPLVPTHVLFLHGQTETILLWKSTFGCYCGSSILGKHQAISNPGSCCMLLRFAFPRC